MATYIELYDLRSNSVLLNQIVIASAVKAQTILDDGASSANEVAWASELLIDPIGKSRNLINYVLAANKAASVAVITAASDATVQANVDTAVDAIIAGGV